MENETSENPRKQSLPKITTEHCLNIVKIMFLGSPKLILSDFIITRLNKKCKKIPKTTKY